MTDRSIPFVTTALTALTALWLSSGLVACSTAPLPSRPSDAGQPERFKTEGPWQSGSAPAPTERSDWWVAFQDTGLNALQAQLLQGNPNLQVLAAQVRSAQAVLQAAGEAYLPTLGLNASATRSATPASNTSSRRTSNSLQLGATAGWEVDLWGRLSQAEQVATARVQASQADLAAARLSAQVTLSQSYFALRAAEAQQALVARSVANYQQSLALTQARYEGGVASQADVLQAQTQLKSAQAQGSSWASQRAQLEHAIAVLIGQPPAELSLAVQAQLPAAPGLPALLPSTLLQRRPDIAAARARVNAAWAQIGVADAAYFPALTLSASSGWRSSAWSDLLSAPALFWSIGPALAQSVLDGGARQLASSQARASAEQAGAQYRQTVLSAWQEVEDNLVLATGLAEEGRLQAEALDSARQLLAITQEQYRAGTVSYLNVVVAQANVFNSESALLSLQSRRLQASSQLLKNLAGPWEGVTPGRASAPS